MRKLLIYIVLCCASAHFIIAEIDPVLAKITLTKTEVVTQRQFKEQVMQLESQINRPFTLEERKQLLDALIGNKILLQAAERANISVTQVETNSMLEVYKQDLGHRAGLNRKLNDDELEKLLQREGLTWDRLLKQIKDQISMEKFVTQEQKDMFTGLSSPTDSEIEEYYESNRTKYPIVSPEMISFKQIVILTKGLGLVDEQNARQKANDIYRQLQNGISFDKFLEVYQDDGSLKKIGGLSFETWRRDDASQKVTYGKDFFDEIFELEQGRQSSVMKSNIGYHIVEVIEKIPFKVLALSDKIPPKNTMTVRDYIVNGLMQIKQKEILQKATLDLLDKLKKESDIQITEKYLSW